MGRQQATEVGGSRRRGRAGILHRGEPRRVGAHVHSGDVRTAAQSGARVGGRSHRRRTRHAGGLRPARAGPVAEDGGSRRWAAALWLSTIQRTRRVSVTCRTMRSAYCPYMRRRRSSGGRDRGTQGYIIGCVDLGGMVGIHAADHQEGEEGPQRSETGGKQGSPPKPWPPAAKMSRPGRRRTPTMCFNGSPSVSTASYPWPRCSIGGWARWWRQMTGSHW